MSLHPGFHHNQLEGFPVDPPDLSIRHGCMGWGVKMVTARYSVGPLFRRFDSPKIKQGSLIRK